MDIVDAHSQSVSDPVLTHLFFSVSPCEDVLPLRVADEVLMKDGISRKIRANVIFLKAIETI